MGESPADMYRVLDVVCPAMPADKRRKSLRSVHMEANPRLGKLLLDLNAAVSA